MKTKIEIENFIEALEMQMGMSSFQTKDMLKILRWLVEK